MAKKKKKPKKKQAGGRLVEIFRRADTAYRNGELEKARKLFQVLLAIKPDHAEALHKIGLIEADSGNFEAGIECVMQSLEINPEAFMPHYNLGVLLQNTGSLAEAEDAFRGSIDANNDYAPAHYNLGVLEQHGELLDSAAKSYQRALELDPTLFQARSNLVEVLKETGDFEELERHLRITLDENPDYTDSWWQIVDLPGFQATDDDIRKLEKITSGYAFHGKVAVAAYVLGRIYEKRENYAQAFKNYKLANESKASSSKGIFDFRSYERHCKTLIEKCDRAFFEDRRDFGSDSEQPVFILGMPRSGTTLVEQILSSHPKVYGAGELLGIHEVYRGIAPKDDEKALINAFLKLNPKMILSKAEDYLEAVTELAPEARLICDKMPDNFKHIWLIQLLFPNARIIHCRRNPVATCLSCYKQNFETDHPYTHDLRLLGKYYQLYENLMNHWREVLPNRIFEIQYEDLIENQEDRTRDLLEYCGLPWDERCLEFYRSRRRVRTNVIGVRQPIYRGSLRQWEKYREFISPLLEELGID